MTASREAARAMVPVRVAENLKLRAEVQLAAVETALSSANSAEARKGIAINHVPGFVVAQLIGAAIGATTARFLFRESPGTDTPVDHRADRQ